MEGAPEEAWDPGPRGAFPMADGRDHHSSEPPLSPIASVRVLKRIPRACRDQAGLKPATVLEGVVIASIMLCSILEHTPIFLLAKKGISFPTPFLL